MCVMAIQFWGGVILFDTGVIAFDPACCCAEPQCAECAEDTTPSFLQLTVTGGVYDGIYILDNNSDPQIAICTSAWGSGCWWTYYIPGGDGRWAAIRLYSVGPDAYLDILFGWDYSFCGTPYDACWAIGAGTIPVDCSVLTSQCNSVVNGWTFDVEVYSG